MQRVVQQFEFAALSKVLPSDLICEALIEHEKADGRRRKLPTQLVVWLSIGMGLFRDLSITDVLGRVVAGLGGAFGWSFVDAPHSTSVTHARDRLGWEVLRTIFRKLAARLEASHSHVKTWRGLAVYALDGTTCRTPDTAANSACFGRPGTSSGRPSASPQLRLITIVNVFTHVVSAAVLGPYTTSEVRLAEQLIDRVKAGSVLLLDRAFHAFVWPALLTERERHFLIRAKQGDSVVKTRRKRRLGPGDYLCTLEASRAARKRFPSLNGKLEVREITVERNGFRPIVLITNLLSAEDYPAAEIAALYRLRWESETGFRELKVDLAGEKVTFRSHRPARVLQEAYGLLIAYNCARALMCEAGVERGVLPTRISFTKTLVLLRSALTRECQCTCLHDDLVQRISYCVLPKKRVGRQCERSVKATPKKYPTKRRGQPAAVSRHAYRSMKRLETQAREAIGA